MLWLLWIIIPALVLLVILWPMRVLICVDASFKTARASVMLHTLLFHKRLQFRIALLESPFLTVVQQKKNGSLGKRIRIRNPKKDAGSDFSWIMDCFSIRQIEIISFVGIENAPVATVGIAASIQQIEETVLCMIGAEKRNVYVEPVFSHNIFRINLEGMLFVFPVKMVKEYLCRKKREKLHVTSY